MASKPSLSPIARAGLSERELLLVAAAFSSLKGGDQTIDWAKFSPLAGYGSANSARVCFRPLQKRLKAFVDSGCGAGLGEIGDTSADAKVPTTPTASKYPTTPGSKTRGRPKKRKPEDKGDEAAHREKEDMCSLPDTVVKEEVVTGQAMEGPQWVPVAAAEPKTPESQCKRIKVEDVPSGDAPWQSKWGTTSDHPLVTPGTRTDTGVPQVVEGPQECQGYYYSYAGEPNFDFGEYVLQDSQEALRVPGGQDRSRWQLTSPLGFDR